MSSSFFLSTSSAIDGRPLSSTVTSNGSPNGPGSWSSRHQSERKPECSRPHWHTAFTYGSSLHNVRRSPASRGMPVAAAPRMNMSWLPATSGSSSLGFVAMAYLTFLTGQRMNPAVNGDDHAGNVIRIHLVREVGLRVAQRLIVGLWWRLVLQHPLQVVL